MKGGGNLLVGSFLVADSSDCIVAVSCSKLLKNVFLSMIY